MNKHQHLSDVEYTLPKSRISQRTSVIVPLLNEGKNAPIICKSLSNELQGFSYELLFIDDESTEEIIWRKIENLSPADARNFKLAKCFGHQNALKVGATTVVYYAITIDRGLRQLLSAISQLLLTWHQGFKTVKAVRSASSQHGALRQTFPLFPLRIQSFK